MPLLLLLAAFVCLLSAPAARAQSSSSIVLSLYGQSYSYNSETSANNASLTVVVPPLESFNVSILSSSGVQAVLAAFDDPGAGLSNPQLGIAISSPLTEFNVPGSLQAAGNPPNSPYSLPQVNTSDLVPGCTLTFTSWSASDTSFPIRLTLLFDQSPSSSSSTGLPFASSAPSLSSSSSSAGDFPVLLVNPDFDDGLFGYTVVEFGVNGAAVSNGTNVSVVANTGGSGQQEHSALLQSAVNNSILVQQGVTVPTGRGYTFSALLTSTDQLELLTRRRRLLFASGLSGICVSTSVENDSCRSGTTGNMAAGRRRLLQTGPSQSAFFGNGTALLQVDCSSQCNNSLVSITLQVPPSTQPTTQLFVSIFAALSGAVATTGLGLESVPYTPPATVTGDPQFTGLLGQRFQVHGVDGGVYNLISDSRLQVNARFVFLGSGSCPPASAVSTACWSHPGSYLGAVSFQVPQQHQGKQDNASLGAVDALVVEAGPAAAGLSAVTANGRRLAVSERWCSAGGELCAAYSGSHSLLVTSPQFIFRLSSSDRFVNQEVAVRVPLSQLSCHGLLGQTRQRRDGQQPGSGRLPDVEGDVDDYAIAGGDLLGSGFVFNQFTLPETRS